MTDETIVSVQGVAEITGQTERQVRSAMQSGSLIPEGYASKTPLFRADTIVRWDNAGRRTMPASPRLETLGMADLSERWHISLDTVKKLRLHRQLPEPDHYASGVLVWYLSTIQNADPLCPSGHRVDAVDSRHRNGRVVEVQCSCSEWVEMRPRKTAAA